MDLPLIDLSRFQHGSGAERDRIARRVDEVCRRTGFFALAGHAIPETSARAERLSIGFFHQPNYDALIECLPGCCTDGGAPRYEPVTSGEHLSRQFSSQVQ